MSSECKSKRWEQLSFDEAVEPISDEGKRVDQRDYQPSGALPVIDQGEDFIGGYTDDLSKAYAGPLPVVIFGDHTRRVKLVNERFAVGAQGVKMLRPREGWDSRFFAYLLPTLPIPNRGYSRHYQFVRKLSFPRPDLEEQQRIVAEIERQFTRLDAGVASLKSLQAALRRYRASVLKAACGGRLVPTEAKLARKENRGHETGEQLLQRILKDRREKWNGKGKYKEPISPNLSDLPQLPDGWGWARLEQLGFIFGGLTKNPKRAKLKKQLPYLRVANVYANELRLDDIEYIGVEDSELPKLRVRIGDLLIVEGNGSKAQIGRLAIWNGAIDPCVHQNHLIKVRPIESRMPNWILHWLQSAVGRQFVELVASSTSGLYTLSVNKVGDFPIALPPLAEQQRIVAEVERRLSVNEELEMLMSTELQRAIRLRQSILKRAFGDSDQTSD